MELKSGPATLRRGAERIGGKLVLDGRLLRFEPHELNVQGKPQVLEVVDIKRLDCAWTKVLGVIPVAPNGLDITMRNGQTFSFTVHGRKGWIETISYAQADTPKG